MPPDPKLSINADIPWSEPSWYRTGNSVYFNISHRHLRDNIRGYVNKNILPYSLGWEEDGVVPEEAALSYSCSGIPLDDIPQQYRPKNVPNMAGITQDKLDVFHLLVSADEIARIEGGVAIALGGASVIGAPPVINYGSEEQKARWLPGLFSRQTNFCLGVTEPSGGSDVAGIQTTAKKSTDGKFYLVNGVKKWITGAPWATHMTTAVRTGDAGIKGISVLVIPLDTPGIEIRKIHNSGQNAGGASFVDLENVEVPVANLIGKEDEGFGIIMRNFNRERFVMAVQCNRKSRTCLSMAFSYAMERKTFGKPLIQNQVIRKKLSEIAHRVEAHWAWLEQVAHYINSSPSGWQTPDIASQISLLKVQGGQMVEMASREAQQIFGGAGYQKGGRGAAVEQISRDLRMLVVGGGSEEILADLAVRQELAAFQARSHL
ncbi:acyl-CoA dehydrogenase [Dactylonectria estremocensis]|uniref:Acyl-CoA dehydrogenase n=1 Tax=Dactylonectria estremocensis TaxID=1079267 RepID=A0A9P9EQ08_9HYPO|nr:acyl-CoA dehydrogenase [Dactylonectria estremocensis]